MAYTVRYSRNSSTVPQIQRPSLCWDPNIECYRLSAPFSEGLITFLKVQIPSDKRSYIPTSREWIFDRTYFDVMRFMVERLWPGAVILPEEVVAKATAEQAQRQASASGSSLDAANQTLRFLELTNLKALPQDYREAKRAYLTTITRLHPDRGGDAAKASELNVCWALIEKAVYKR